MRFCEYIQNYRKEMGWSYVSIARQCGLTAPTVRKHYHGDVFPPYGTFCLYFKEHILSLHHAAEAVGYSSPYWVDGIVIGELYDYFKAEERKYRHENKDSD